jgi:hypothetical protein
MLRVKTRIVVPVALAAIALAGCSDDEPVDLGAAPTSPAAAAPSSPVATNGKVVPSSPAPSAKVSGATAGCPVTVAVLEKAFKASAAVAGAIVLGKGLKDISCYQGWATAVTQPTNLEAAVVLFKYDAAKKTWVAQSGGTDGVCREAVPQDVATHLKGCQN